MVSVEDAIQPFIPMLNMGVSLDDLLTPILDENPELSRESVLESLQAHIKPTVKHIPSISKWKNTLMVFLKRVFAGDLGGIAVIGDLKSLIIYLN